MKIHDEIDDWSAGALCGALTPGEIQEFERHLAECPRCRSLHEEDRKMNETLKETLSADRPDADFEQRVIKGVRGKIKRPWFNPWIELHPLRGLIWLMQFRVAQAAVALLVLAMMVSGMVVGGALISGERLPWRKTPGTESMQKLTTNAGANGTRAMENTTVTATGVISSAVFLTGTNPSLAAMTFNSSAPNFVVTTTGSATASPLDTGIAGATFAAGTAAPNGSVPGYWNGSAAGQGSWNTFASGGNNTNWATNNYWGDTMAKDLGGIGAPGITGTASIGDTATFNVASGANIDTGTVRNNAALVFIGTGTQALSGSNSYSGMVSNSGTTLGKNTFAVTATDGNAVGSGTLDVLANRVITTGSAGFTSHAGTVKPSGYFGGGDTDLNGNSVTGGNPKVTANVFETFSGSSPTLMINATGTDSL
ncbi:MAG TPA: zf-HC2 domain-containing protein, partial [Chthoniobacteraceae bacterium]|nr:zf-HC2 domain-containing protein [Chthoniobacteraceae bacterium]